MYFSGTTFTFDLENEASDVSDQQAIGRPRTSSLTVEIVFKSEYLTPSGEVASVGDLAALGTYLDGDLDSHVNEAFDLPLTEARLARHLFAWCMENLPTPLSESLSEVRVSATPRAWASYGAGST